MVPTPVTEVPFVMVSADQIQKDNEQLMEKELGELLTQTGMEGKGLVRIGMASDEIRQVCEEDPDVFLIVMGMRGSGGLEKLMGSTTNNVLRKVKVPLLIVPHHSNYRPIEKVTYPSDFSYHTSTALYQPLLDIVHAYKAELTILHIHLNHNGESERIIRGKKELGILFEGLPLGFEMLEYASVNEGIHHHLENRPADLLVMVAHKHSFLERLFSKQHTEAMVVETHLPLLILQDKP
jgi:nucleotide-binding universal stress UspA family protein